MRFSHIWYHVFGGCFFMAVVFVMGVLTVSFALPTGLHQTFLEFRKGLAYKDFVSRDFKLLVYLHDHLENNPQFQQFFLEFSFFNLFFFFLQRLVDYFASI